MCSLFASRLTQMKSLDKKLRSTGSVLSELAKEAMWVHVGGGTFPRTISSAIAASSKYTSGCITPTSSDASVATTPRVSQDRSASPEFSMAADKSSVASVCLRPSELIACRGGKSSTVPTASKVDTLDEPGFWGEDCDISVMLEGAGEVTLDNEESNDRLEANQEQQKQDAAEETSSEPEGLSDEDLVALLADCAGKVSSSSQREGRMSSLSANRGIWSSSTGTVDSDAMPADVLTGCEGEDKDLSRDSFMQGCMTDESFPFGASFDHDHGSIADEDFLCA